MSVVSLLVFVLSAYAVALALGFLKVGAPLRWLCARVPPRDRVGRALLRQLACPATVGLFAGVALSLTALPLAGVWYLDALVAAGGCRVLHLCLLRLGGLRGPAGA